MKKLIKVFLKVFVGLLTTIFLLILTYYSYYKWKQTRQYDEKITVTAYYMKYACGDCSIDMNVSTVNNKKYKFIIGKDIFPTPKTKNFEELCDFVSSIGLKSSTGPNYVEEEFTLVGHLHKYGHGLPIFDCSDAPFFTVEKIKYGKQGNWKKF